MCLFKIHLLANPISTYFLKIFIKVAKKVLKYIFMSPEFKFTVNRSFIQPHKKQN